MENTITLTSGQKLEILMQNEVTQDIDCSISYIKSGEQELNNYVQHTIKPNLDAVITSTQSIIKQQINQGINDASVSAANAAQQVIDENITDIKNDIVSFSESNIKPELTALVQTASEYASITVNKSAEALNYAQNAFDSAQQADNSVLIIQNTIKNVEDEISQIRTDMDFYTTQTMVDGQWIANYKVLSTATGVNEYTLDLSDYLPNDGYMYEVMVSTYLSRTDDSGTNTYLPIYNTSLGIDGTDGGEGKTNSFMNDAVDGANMQQSGGGCVVIVGANRTLNYGIRQHKLTAFALNAVAYRRIGTNG